MAGMSRISTSGSLPNPPAHLRLVDPSKSLYYNVKTFKHERWQPDARVSTSVQEVGPYEAKWSSPQKNSGETVGKEIRHRNRRTGNEVCYASLHAIIATHTKLQTDNTVKKRPTGGVFRDLDLGQLCRASLLYESASETRRDSVTDVSVRLAAMKVAEKDAENIQGKDGTADRVRIKQTNIHTEPQSASEGERRQPLSSRKVQVASPTPDLSTAQTPGTRGTEFTLGSIARQSVIPKREKTTAVEERTMLSWKIRSRRIPEQGLRLLAEIHWHERDVKSLRARNLNCAQRTRILEQRKEEFTVYQYRFVNGG